MTDYHRRSDDTWASARADYLAGASAPEVCARYDLTESTLRRRAREERWRKTDAPDPLPVDLREDDGSPLPSIIELQDDAWRRHCRAHTAGRLGEARGWLALWDRYRAMQAAAAEAARRESTTELAEIQRVAEAGLAAATAVRRAVEAQAETPDDTNDTNDTSSEAPPLAASRLKLSLLEAALKKAHRRRDPAALARCQAKYDAYKAEAARLADP